MKKLLVLMSSIIVSSTASSVIVACEPEVNFTGNGTTPTTPDENGGDTDGDGEEIDGNGDLVYADVVYGKLKDLKNFQTLDALNNELKQVQTNIYGVKDLTASPMIGSATDVIVFITIHKGFVMYAQKYTISLAGALVDNKLIKTKDIITATERISDAANIGEVNNLLKMLAPNGVELSATLVTQSTSDVTVKIVVDTENGWKLEGDDSFVLKNAITGRETSRNKSLNDLWALLRDSAGINQTFADLDAAVEHFDKYTRENRDQISIALMGEEIHNADQLQVIEFGPKEPNVVLVYYRFGTRNASGIFWETKISTYPTTVRIKSS